MGVTSSTDHLLPLLISPAEPAWLKEKLASRFHLLSTARLTESRGVDVAWLVEGDATDQTGQSDAWWGVQRKTVDDLIRIGNEIFSDDEMAMLGGIIGFWFGSRGAKK